MKMKFSKLFIIFGVLLCICALYGCGKVTETTAEEKETASTADETTSVAEETSAEITETEAKTVETSETEETNVVTESTTAEVVETTEITEEEITDESKEGTWISGTVVADSNDLVVELVDYMQNITAVGIEPISKNFDAKITSIKNGVQALHAVFDYKSEYYFVCGYYNQTHEFEAKTYCCRNEYTWVRYEKEDEICEYYNGERIVVAFQINVASYVADILTSEKEISKIEYYQLYEVHFVDGLNVNNSIPFFKTFIYLNQSDKSAVYHTDIFYRDWTIFSCVFFEDQYFIIDYLFTAYSDGRETKMDNHYKYGEYYDVLMAIMLPDRGVAAIDEDATHYYGLIPIDDFVVEVLN